MCMKTNTKVATDVHESVATKTTHTTSKNEQFDAPTHSSMARTSSYDWCFFLVPALFWKITPVGPLYATGILRIIASFAFLSLHYQFVDKDNYLNKLSRKQLQREGSDFLTGIYLHMWAQVALQIVFPSLFFTDSSEIWECAKETLLSHIFIVEPLYYVAHRWLHHPKQMKAMHGFHHSSIQTLPTTASVQNFKEHFIYIAVFGPAFFVPFLLQGRQHWAVVGAYLVLFDIINSWGHTNVRVRNWLFTSPYSPFFYLFYTPEFHLGHHAYFRANYGLFMPFWDYALGTYREYRKKDIQLLPKEQQDFVFIGHNGGLGHFLTIPEFCVYNVYDDYKRFTWLPLKVEFLFVHLVVQVYRLLFGNYYYGSRYCVANEYVGRIICLARSPYDYMSPKSYDEVNKEILELMKKQHRACGTRYFGLGNLNKMKQLNDGGRVIAQMVKDDPYLCDKKIRVWTGDTLTVASVYNQIADIPDLDSLFYIGASGKIGTAVCELLVKAKPNLKIRIFSRHHSLSHPNISYTNDLSEITKHEVALVGKFLSGSMYANAFRGKKDCRTRFILDYTVPAFPIEAVMKRPENIEHIRVGLLKTKANNAFLKGPFDVCMGHDENHIVPCHFGCLLNTVNGRENNEVGEIDQGDVQKLWQMAGARGFRNIDFE